MGRTAGQWLGITTVPIILVVGLGLYLAVQARSSPPAWPWQLGMLGCVVVLIALMWPTWTALRRDD